MAPAPNPLGPLEDSLLETLEGYPDGIQVRELAQETDSPEHSVRRALSNLEKLRRVTKKKGEATGPGMRPPYLWSRVPKELEEVPPMPTINEAIEEEEAEQNLQDGDGEAPRGEAPFTEEGGAVGTEEVPESPLGHPAKGVQNTIQKREVLEAGKEIDRRTGHKVGGTRRIQRVDPVAAGFPEEEKGMLGPPVELSVVGPIEDFIRETYGGGAFVVHPCDQTGNPYGGRPYRVEIAGLPKPVTEAGRMWLKRRKDQYGEDGGEGSNGSGKKKGEMTTFELLELLNSREKSARQEAQTQFQQTLQLLKPTGPDAASLEALKSSHATELSQVRGDCEKRISDAKTPYTNQIDALTKQVEGLKTELKDQKRDLDAASDRRAAELRALHDKELLQAKEAAKEKFDAATANFTEKAARLEKEFAAEAKRLEDKFKLEYDLKAARAEPKDMQSQIQKGMIPEMVKLAIAQAKKAAGLDDDSPGTWGDTLKEMALEAGPDIVKRAANALLSIAEEKAGVRGTPAQARPATGPARPAIAAAQARPGSLLSDRNAPAAPAAVPAMARDRVAPAAPPAPVILTEEQQAALIASGGAPMSAAPPEEPVITEEPAPVDEAAQQAPAADPAAAAAELRIQAFLEVMFTEMRIESEAPAAWESPIPQTEWTLEDLYYKLPRKVRKSIEDVEPRQVWDSLLDALGTKPADHPLLNSIQEHLNTVGTSRAWLEEFFEAGPWNEPEEEEEEEEGAPPDAAQ